MSYKHKWIHVNPGYTLCAKCDISELEIRNTLINNRTMPPSYWWFELPLSEIGKKIPCEVSDEDYKLKALL